MSGSILCRTCMANIHIGLFCHHVLRRSFFLGQSAAYSPSLLVCNDNNLIPFGGFHGFLRYRYDLPGPVLGLVGGNVSVMLFFLSFPDVVRKLL